MANLALGKLPVEKEVWGHAELATNGDIQNYSGLKGFAHAHFPATYTLDFEEIIFISTIRILLWDNLGINSKGIKAHSRKYTFDLSYSEDGNNYIRIFTNRTGDGSNGWFIFSFAEGINARFIRLTCINNTANDEFHIVEVEVHDTIPAEINSTNQKSFFIDNDYLNADSIRRLVTEIIADKGQSIELLQEKVEEINKSGERIKDALQIAGLIGKSKTFLDESENNKQTGIRWIYLSITLFILFSLLMSYFLWCDDKTKSMLTEGYKNHYSESHITLIISFYYAGKAVMISAILYIMSWSLKNYRSERHNYVVNKHKAISFMTANEILVNKDYQEIDRYDIFKQASAIAFSHQNTGYGKEEQGSPNTFNATIKNE